MSEPRALRTVWYIRHGESRGNAGLRTATPDGTELTERGRRQAEHIADYIAGAPLSPDLVITSSYVRTKQTAAATLARFSAANHEEWNLHEFTFLEPSDYFNSTMAERRPAVARYWERADPAYRDGPNAESFQDFMTRVQSGLEDVRRRREQFTTIFSHGFVIRAVLWLLLNRPVSLTSEHMHSYWRFFRSVSVPNASVVKLYLPDDGETLLAPPTVTYLPDDLRTT